MDHGSLKNTAHGYAHCHALYWLWSTDIANESESFSTKEDVHEYHKEKFLIHIYERDDPGYASMIDSLRGLYAKGLKHEATYLRKKIIQLTSTTDASVKQFTEYLKEIENEWNGKVYLKRDEDRYYKAMGIKNR